MREVAERGAREGPPDEGAAPAASLAQNLAISLVSAVLNNVTGGLFDIMLAKAEEEITKRAIGNLRGILTGKIGGFVAAQVSSLVGSTGSELFFGAMLQSLVSLHTQSLEEFESDYGGILKQPTKADMVTDATDLLQSLREARGHAQALMLVRASEQWAVAKAQAENGLYQDPTTGKQGTNLGASLRDTGVLKIGTHRGLCVGQQPTVAWAEIREMSKTVKQVLGATPIGAMSIPIVISAPYPISNTAGADVDRLCVGKNEAGTIWIEQGFDWFADRARAAGQQGEDNHALAYKGAYYFLNVDMAQVKVGGAWAF